MFICIKCLSCYIITITQMNYTFSITPMSYTIPNYNYTNELHNYNYTIPNYNYTNELHNYNYTIPNYTKPITLFNYTNELHNYNYTIPNYTKPITPFELHNFHIHLHNTTRYHLWICNFYYIRNTICLVWYSFLASLYCSQW